MTPTEWPAASARRASAAVTVLFPTPGGPVMPMRTAPLWRGISRSRIPGTRSGRSSTVLISRAQATRLPWKNSSQSAGPSGSRADASGVMLIASPEVGVPARGPVRARRLRGRRSGRGRRP